MQLQPLPPRGSLVDQVVSKLTAQIRDGTVKPGGRLPGEVEIARQLRVSRSVVREALTILRAEELIESRRGQGVFVNEQGTAGVLRLKIPDLSEIKQVQDMLELRAGLEAQAAQLAAARRSEEDVALLEEALTSMIVAGEAGLPGVEEDLYFHQLVAAASKNASIIEVLNFLGGSLRRSIGRSRANDALRIEFLLEAREEHMAIVRAIAQGDGEMAGLKMRWHMERSWRRLKKGLC
ncbi:transcriptional regulator, GntR family [Arboricoccus pini]|uniref:Transcriptional regulator, GntR family n=1 Tax=Arboricoccus pini TaxID=1963835 RepID=A0A212RUL6_9PROT|nr:FadR/GntR family transcriptional regulator [Arboricoccus pini]SNB76363.1 transcriptional regulator, GntR family [Arboricoccus pini]